MLNLGNFELVLVGGTGQWYLLELALRTLRGEDGVFPKRYWLVDRDFDLEDKSHVSWHLKETLWSIHSRGLLNLTWETDLDPRARLCQPRVPDNEDLHHVANLPGYNWESILFPTLTARERNIPVSKGFYALPRLGATWVSLHGFQGLVVPDPKHPEYALPEFLGPDVMGINGDPLLIVGSVVGGTGAGLLPLLLTMAREAEPTTWRRKLLVAAILPWFNPEPAPDPTRPVTDAGVALHVRWKDCCRGAKFGVEALFRRMQDIQERGTPHNTLVPFTYCVFAGPPIDEAKARPPLRAAECVNKGFTAPVLQYLAEALPAALADVDNVNLPQKFMVGGLEVPRVKGRTGDAESFTALTEAHHFARFRLQALADFDLEPALGGSFGLQRLSGLGAALQGMALSASLSTPPQHRTFLEAFRNRLIARAELLSGPVPFGGSEEVAKNIGWLLEDLDAVAASTPGAKDLLMLRGEYGKNPEERGKEIANLVADLLVQHAVKLYREADKDVSGRLAHLYRKSGGMEIESVFYLSHQFNPYRRTNANPRIEKFAAPDIVEEPKRFARALDTPDHADLGTGFISRSYATFLSASHVLENKTRSWREASDPEGDPVARWVTRLWRAAVLNLVTFEPVQGPMMPCIKRTERVEKDFTDPVQKVIWDPGTGKKVAMGFLSTTLGLVPHVDLLETDPLRDEHGNADLVRFQALKTRFETMLQEHSQNTQIDELLLRAFARKMEGQNRVKLASPPPWYSLLAAVREERVGDPGVDATDLEVYGGPLSTAQDYIDLMASHSLEGLEVALTTTTGVERFHIPMKVQAAEANAIIQASLDHPDLIQKRAESGRTRLVLVPFEGEREEDVLVYVGTPGSPGFQLTAVHAAGLDRAARALQ